MGITLSSPALALARANPVVQAVARLARSTSAHISDGSFMFAHVGL